MIAKGDDSPDAIWSAILSMSPNDPERGLLAWAMEGAQLLRSMETYGVRVGTADELVNILLATEPGRPLRVQYDGVAVHFRPVRTMDAIVHLHRLRVTGFAALRDFEMDFESHGQRGQWTLLIGENGVGKSSVLRALSLAIYSNLDVPRALLAARGGARLVRDDADAAIIDVITSVGSWNGRIGRGADGEFFQTSGMSGLPFGMFGYGAGRATARNTRDRAPFTEPDMLATLFDPNASLVNADAWLRDLRLGATESVPQQVLFDQVIDTLTGVLPGVTSIDVSSAGVVLRGPSVGTVPLAAASDGYLTMAAWVTDLIARWTVRAAKRGPLPENFTRVMTGLVLIDEIDLHLHPRWQRAVVQTLRTTFPKMSFVATTHNPLTLLGARDGEVHVLRRHGRGDVAVHQIDLPRGLRADQVLTGEWFDLASTLDDDTLRLLKRHRRLIATSPDGAGAEELRERLRERLGSYADTSLERLALSVAGEIMREDSETLTAAERRRARAEIKRIVAARDPER